MYTSSSPPSVIAFVYFGLPKPTTVNLNISILIKAAHVSLASIWLCHYFQYTMYICNVFLFNNIQLTSKFISSVFTYLFLLFPNFLIPTEREKRIEIFHNYVNISFNKVFQLSFNIPFGLLFILMLGDGK